jgi:hypothetical protein
VQQTGQLAADGQAEPGAAVAAAGRAVGLLEGVEDDLLLAFGMPMPVSMTLMATGVLASRPGLDADDHPPLVGELGGVGEEVLQDLADLVAVAVDARGRVGGVDLQVQPALDLKIGPIIARSSSTISLRARSTPG